MKNWIKVVARFQDAESDVQKLMPHGADDELSGLARERQAILELLTPVGFVPGDHGRPGEGFAQEGMTDLSYRLAGARRSPAWLWRPRYREEMEAS